MSDSIALRLRQLLGNEAVERDASGLPRAVPDSTENAARVLSAAHEQGWRVRIEGRGGWLAADAPADLALSTQSLARLTSVSPADLVASVEAGVPLVFRNLRQLLLQVDAGIADQNLQPAAGARGCLDERAHLVFAAHVAGKLHDPQLGKYARVIRPRLPVAHENPCAVASQQHGHCPPDAA